MKTMSVLGMALLLCVGPVVASKGTENTLALTALAADWLGTREMVNHPAYDPLGRELWSEVNPLLGRHPSVGDVDKYFLVAAATYLLVQQILPEPWDSRFRRLTIIVEVGCTASHFGIGVTF